MHSKLAASGVLRQHGRMLIIDLSHIRPGAAIVLGRRLNASERRARAARLAAAPGRAGDSGADAGAAMAVSGASERQEPRQAPQELPRQRVLKPTMRA